MSIIKQTDRFPKKLQLLLLLSLIARALIAAFVELGNDEVYYWTYALYPDWSHFDHPFMVGFVIQLFSLDLLFDSEIFIRLAAIVFGTINTYLIFLITSKLKNEKAGFIAALLFTSSIYCFIISGTFILPDAPQTLFWLLSVNSMLIVTDQNIPDTKRRKQILLLGFLLGLGILSKYTSVFLWFGFGLFVLLFQREWLKKMEFYLAKVISLICILPILIWNLQNNFISFTFQSERVELANRGLRFDFIGTEIFGQILYNNPVVYIVILLSVISLIRNKLVLKQRHKQLFLLISLPLIFTFLSFSLFRSTLPHWTGPAYMSLIPIAAIYLYERMNKKTYSWPVIVALVLLATTLFIGFIQIKTGIFELDKNTELTNKGKNDFSLDLYGWRQLGEQFEKRYQSDLSHGLVDKNVVIVSNRWFPAANLDYYVASPIGIRLMGMGSLERIHKYAWINDKRGGLEAGMDAYFITLSNDYFDPKKLYSNHFEQIDYVEAIPLTRGNEIVKFAHIFRMKSLKNFESFQHFNN